MAKSCKEKKEEKEGSRSPTVLPGFRDVPWVSALGDQLAHPAVSVGGEQSARFDEQSKAVVECVALFWAILRKEAVAQGIITHNILHLHVEKRGQCSGFVLQPLHNKKKLHSDGTQEPRYPFELRVCKQKQKQDHSLLLRDYSLSSNSNT